MADHDNGYKLLFSHPAMVEDLIRGFVHEDWVAELDFATLEKVSGTFVADDLRDREDDVIWRVRWGREWLYVYLLLEFQSRTDRFMAVRMLTYVGLLYQELIRGAQLTEHGKLPPVLPLVLYNGRTRWRAATEVAELIDAIPGGLERYCPRMLPSAGRRRARGERAAGGAQSRRDAVPARAQPPARGPARRGRRARRLAERTRAERAAADVCGMDQAGAAAGAAARCRDSGNRGPAGGQEHARRTRG
ncbi:MAG TPA: Rpn family recombination-promoting nuclease/putative transposase [Rhodocyclaceae bacterium]|nr:Rpn family recombination-promoting nuclease/putative transposase [Rhodocyclaceae bacterium]